MKKFIAWSLLCMLGGVPAGAQGSQYCIRQDNPGFGNLFGRRPDREMYVYVYQ